MTSASKVQANDERDLGAFIPSFLDDYPLNPFEFRVYAHIARRAGSGQCWESVGAIAKHCYMNVRTTRAAVQQLAKHGLITYEERPGQTNLIKLTHHSHWTPAAEVTPTKAGNPTPSKFDRASKDEPRPNLTEPTPVKFDGTPSANLTDHPYPNLDAPPLSNLDDKGTPYEGTPNKVLPRRGGEEAKIKTLPPSPAKETVFEANQSEPTHHPVNSLSSGKENVPPRRVSQSQNGYGLNPCQRSDALFNRPASYPWTGDKDFFEYLTKQMRPEDDQDPRAMARRFLSARERGTKPIEDAYDYWEMYQELPKEKQQAQSSAPPVDGDWTKHPKFNELVADYKSQNPMDFAYPHGKKDELRFQFLQWAFNNIEVSA